MRTTTFLLTLFLLTLNVNAQTDTIVEYFKNIPEISAEHEVLNRDLFPGVISKKQRDSLISAFENYKLLIKKAKSKEELNKISNPYEGSNLRSVGKDTYIETDKNGVAQKYYFGFGREEVAGRDFINPYIYIHRHFYLNDSIRSKGLRTIVDFPIGKWYSYDNEGNLIKVKDTDEGYDFTAADIINYCIKEGINLDRKYPSSYNASTEIRKKKDENGKPVWSITYRLGFMKMGYIVIDGKTGVVLSRREEIIMEECGR